MARNIASMLREAEVIKKAAMLNERQKAHALTMLQKEIDELLGQGSLDLGGTTHASGDPGGVPPAPQSTPAAKSRS